MVHKVRYTAKFPANGAFITAALRTFRHGGDRKSDQDRQGGVDAKYTTDPSAMTMTEPFAGARFQGGK